MAIGKTNSYGTIQPIQRDYVGDAMDTVEQNAFRYRAEERLKKDAAQKAEEARQKEIDELKGDFNASISGYSGIDDPVYDFAMKSKEEFANLQRQLADNPNMSYSEKAEIKRKADRYNQSFKYLNQFGPLLKNKVTEIEKGIKEGKYYDGDLERIQKELKQFESGKYELLIDANGNPKVKIYETNEEGKPLRVLKETGLGDFVNGLNPRKNFKYEDALNKITQGVKGFTKGTQFGSVINEKTTITPEIQSSANSFADYVVTDPEIRSIMEEQFGVTGNELRKKVVDDYLARIEQKDVQKLDSAYSRLAYDRTKDEKKEQVRFEQVDIPKSMRSIGIEPAKGFKAVSVSSAVKPIDFAGGVSFPKISTYTVTTDSFGKPGIYAEIIYPDIKTSTLSPEEKSLFEKFRSGETLTETEELAVSKITKGAENKTKTIKLDDNESSKFAMNMGVSLDEMVNLAKGNPNEKTDIEIWNEEFKKPKIGKETETKGKWSTK
jgi:hypothetical protein